MEEIPKTCANQLCQDLFFTIRTNQLYCSDACKNRWFERQKSRRLKDKVFKLLGNKCRHCGFDDIRALQIDHVNGGGVKELRAVSNKRVYYGRLLKFFESNPEQNLYQLLCANCNWIKRHTNKEK